jgi:sigma-B regulation protein RsbU (phosphoserine phosphatase)
MRHGAFLLPKDNNVSIANETLAVEKAASFAGLLDSKILIVDDSALCRRILAEYLSHAGYTNLIFAADGVEAVEKVQAEKPDLLILDLVMPQMDGFDVCETLRDDLKYRDLPIIVQTAMEAQHQRVKVFHVGATDLVMKPVNDLELLARVRLHLENRALIRDLSVYRNRMRQELELAHGMQTSLLPSAARVVAFEERYGIRLFSIYEASMGLGGDMWGIHAIDDQRFALFVIDFAGHGVGSALNTFRLHSFMNHSGMLVYDPVASVTAINDFLHDALSVGQFATMFYGVVDLARDRIDYVSAGAPPPLLCPDWNGGADLDACEASGLPLGISDMPQYELRCVPFGRDALFLLYSDAVLETPDPVDAVFDTESLAKFMAQRNRNNDCADAVLEIRQALGGTSETGLPDDLTIVALHHNRDG